MDMLAVPGARNFYVLGSFAKSVTVYSQQVRALGLVDAMLGLGRLSKNSRVAVIGGGISGVTVAAALGKVGVAATVYEKEATLFPLQWNSSKRYLHPHIYDWPISRIEDEDAALPLMSWKAQRADSLAKHLKSEWDRLVAHVDEPVVHSEVQRVEVSGAGWRVHGGGERVFDAVVSCVGFGVEDSRFSYPYWADLPLDDPAVHSKLWLVSGAGDGALTDLMRLCIKNFAHEDALGKVVAAVENNTQASELEELRNRVRSGCQGIGLFDGLDLDAIAAALELRDNPVILNASEASVFGTAEQPARSSVLNRLVTRVLIKAGKVTSVVGAIDVKAIVPSLSPSSSGYQVPIGNRTLQSDELLLRHGPNAPFGKAAKPRLPAWIDSGMRRNISRLARRWSRLYRDELPDPTVDRRHWSAESNMFSGDRLPPDFSRVPGLLVYSRELVGGDSVAFENAARAALGDDKVRSALREAMRTGDSGDHPMATLCVEDAVGDARRLAPTIRSLCEAPVAIFDGTTPLAALMLLLGMRAVVRRGVTVVVHVGELDVEAWQRMPFSLRELGVVEVADRHGRKTCEVPLRDAMVEGLKLYARRPFTYSDLPGFAAIRGLGGSVEDYAPRTKSEQVLVLCSFHEDYGKNCWPQVQRAIGKSWPDGSDEGPARRVVDLESPALVNTRLFSAIRRNEECIVDLSFDSKNVYFELGARLVANLNGARIIRCTDEFAKPLSGAAGGVSAAAVENLFGVRPYSCEGGEDGGPAAAIMPEASWPGGAVTPEFAFRMAQNSVDPAQEAGGRSLATLLWSLMEEALGEKRTRSLALPVLYAQNPQVRAQVYRFGFDAMLAWVVFTDSVGDGEDDRRNVALAEMESMVDDLAVDEDERRRLRDLVAKLRAN